MREHEKTKFQWDACDYAEHSNAQQKWAKELISQLCLGGNEFLLDIGCDDGKVTAEIASYLPAGFVMGIDNSEEMISLFGICGVEITTEQTTEAFSGYLSEWRDVEADR